MTDKKLFAITGLCVLTAITASIVALAAIGEDGASDRRLQETRFIPDGSEDREVFESASVALTYDIAPPGFLPDGYELADVAVAVLEPGQQKFRTARAIWVNESVGGPTAPYLEASFGAVPPPEKDRVYIDVEGVVIFTTPLDPELADLPGTRGYWMELPNGRYVMAGAVHGTDPETGQIGGAGYERISDEELFKFVESFSADYAE